MTDYANDFAAFRVDLCPVEGDHGPKAIVPDWLTDWYRIAFPDGNPAARNIMDARSKKQGKSSDAAAVALYLATRRPHSEVVICASTKDQAQDRVLRAAKFAIESGPLSQHAKVYRDAIEFDNKSIVKAIPADWRGAAGGNYSGVIFDELWVYTLEAQRRLFDELLIPPSVNHGVRWIASYAGFLGESELLHEWWKAALDGKRIHDLPIYSAPDLSLLAFIDTGKESWRQAWVTPEYIAEVEASERPNTFARLWLNEWRSNESQFVTREQWADCRGDVLPHVLGDGRRLMLGADASTSRDLTALVGCWKNKAGKVEVLYSRVWKPKKTQLRFGKPTVDLAAGLGAAVRELHAARQIDCITADPYQLHTLMIEWERAGIRVVEMPQTGQRTESDQALYDAIIGKALLHYGDPTLTEHVLNSVARETPRGFRLDKEKTSRKIDAAVALSMAHFNARTKRSGSGIFIGPADGKLVNDDRSRAEKAFDSDRGWKNCP